MEDYKYEIESPALHWRIRHHSKRAAILDRGCLLKQFIYDQHLEKLEEMNVGYSFQSAYPISTNEISYLYNIRDKILLRYYDKKYIAKQIKIDQDCESKVKECEILRDRKESEKETLASLKQHRRSSSTDKNRIYLDARIGTASKALQTTTAQIAQCEAALKNMTTMRIKNYDNWQKQISAVEKTIELAVGEYIKSATRRIETKYGFTDFVHSVKPYDEGMKKILKGEY